jgi:dTDP-glucose pyrophosphorylase
MRLFSPTYKAACIDQNGTIKDAITSLNTSGLLIVCVVDADYQLYGIVTDADIRRAMLQGKKLEDGISDILNRFPLTASIDETPHELAFRSRETAKREIPLLDNNGRVCDLYISGLTERRVPAVAGAGIESKKAEPLDNWMFILAGGLGTRLRSVVSDRPKPLAVVGDKALIEHLIDQAAACGITQFYVSLNYMADAVIEFLSQKRFAHFKFEFIIEQERLGTAGSLGYIAQKVDKPIIVCNADLLTKIRFESLLQYHDAQAAVATCVIRQHHVTVPFGVVEVLNGRVENIVEKPSYDVLINAGIYVLNPQVVRKISNGRYLDMPDFIRSLIASGGAVSSFFMHEYWLDVGKPEDYQRAKAYLSGESVI